MDKLQEAIANSPLVKAAVVEAVHRFYHDRILSPRQEDKMDLVDTNAEAILSKLWNLHPDWRHILHEVPKRYKSFPTNSVSTFGKPKEEIIAFVVQSVIFI